MKILIRFIFGIGVIVFLLAISAFFYVKYNGRVVIERSVEAYLKQNVHVEKIAYQFPLGVQLTNVRIGDILKIEKFYARVELRSLLNSKWVVSKVFLWNPSLIINRGSVAKIGVNQNDHQIGKDFSTESQDQKSSLATKVADKHKERKILIRHISVQDGMIHYLQKKKDKSISITLEDVAIVLNNITVPIQPEQTDFQISAIFIQENNPFSGNQAQGSGWINIIKKDMDATLRIIDSDGNTPLNAEIVSKDNEMIVQGNIKLQQLFKSFNKPKFKGASQIGQFISGAMGAVGINLSTGFSFQTKMDDFRLTNVSLSGNMPTTGIKNLLKKTSE